MDHKLFSSVCGTLLSCHRGNLALSNLPEVVHLGGRIVVTTSVQGAVRHPDANKKGQKAACNVPENERREPGFSNRVRNRYGISKPCLCKACTAYISRWPGEV